MKNPKQLSLRVIRKAAHLNNRGMGRALGFTAKVENKISRILDGTDYSVKPSFSIPFEKIWYILSGLLFQGISPDGHEKIMRVCSATDLRI